MPPFFNRFDICEAYSLALQHCWDSSNAAGRLMYARYCKLTRPGFFRPAPSLSVETLSENGRAIYDKAYARLLASYSV